MVVRIAQLIVGRGIKQIIRNDGGKSSITIEYPDKLGIWETILNDSFD
jgi:hypothetical protein